MIYVMSDIHGEYGKYLAMLEKIHFSDEDTLYVLGDAVDRGSEPIRLLEDMAARSNVYLIKGNHEAMASYVLRALNVQITRENAQTHLTSQLMQAIITWQHDGGSVTMQRFRALDAAARADLLDYIDDAPLYDVVDADGRTFVLVHAGLGGHHQGKKLPQYTFDELACMRPDFSRRCFDDPDVFVVCGHTPTLAVTGKPEIFHANGYILIDCGAAFGGALACLCLDTMQEFYI